jgi:branched-chain amino acid transport system substrate-binding protein
MKAMGISLHRARWLAAALISTFAAAVAGCGASNSSSGGSGAASSSGKESSTIKIGILAPRTGNFAPNGNDELAGWNVALKQLGDTINGKKVQTIPVDDACDPNQGLTAARRLVQQEHVVAIFGPTCANEALALRPYIMSTGVPMLTVSCADELATSQKADNIFVSATTCDQATLPLGKYAYDTLKYRKVTVLGLDFAYGWATIGGFTKSFTDAGGKIEKRIWVPATASDWSPYINQIPKSTDAVVALTSGAATLKFTKAYKQFGLLGKVPLIGASTLTDSSVLSQEDPEMAKSILSAGTYVDGLDTPENQKFAAAFKESAGKYPGLYGEDGYTAYQLLKAALEKAGGDGSDHKALVNALKGISVDAPRGKVTLDPSVNAPIENVYLSKVQEVDGALRNVATQTLPNQTPWGSFDKNEWLQFAAHYTRTS